MEFTLPKDFQMDQPPVKGESRKFLVEAKLTSDPEKGGESKWEVSTVDGVPISGGGSESDEMLPDDEGAEGERPAAMMMAPPTEEEMPAGMPLPGEG